MPHRHNITRLPDDSFVPVDAELGPDEVGDFAAAAARLLRERAEIVLNSVASGIFCLDPEGRTIFVNEEGARMFGYSQREMLGRSQHDLIHHHYADGTEFPVDDCPISATVTDGITQRVGGDVFWRKDGTPIPVDYSSIPLKEGRRVAGAVVTFRDVSMEQRAERQQELLDRERTARDLLAASEERLRLAMWAGRMGSWEWDVVSGTVWWSPEEEALYGLEPGTFEGTPEAYAERIHPDDREAAQAALQESIDAHSEVHTVTHRVVWPRGEVRWLDSYGRFIYDADGQPVRLVGVSLDATERVAQEAQASHLQHMLESAFEASPSAISLTEGPDHVLRWANRYAREMLGDRVVVGKPIRELVPELAEQGFLALLDRVYETGERYEASGVEAIWSAGADMRQGRFNVVYEPLRDAQGTVTGVMQHSVAC